MSEEIFDVIMLSTNNFLASLETFQKGLPPDHDFYLEQQFWVGDLPKGISPKLVFDACDSPGWNFHLVRQYGMRYAFCRRVEPKQKEFYRWDHDQTMGSAILLSRLIRPTTIGTALSARLFSKAMIWNRSFQARHKAGAHTPGSWQTTNGAIGSLCQSWSSFAICFLAM